LTYKGRLIYCYSAPAVFFALFVSITFVFKPLFCVALVAIYLLQINVNAVVNASE